MLKNPCKATKFNYDTHDNPPESPLGKGGLKGGVFRMKAGWPCERSNAESGILTRRDFLGFFLLGGLVSLFSKKVHAEQKPKEAMFWKRLD